MNFEPDHVLFFPFDFTADFFRLFTPSISFYYFSYPSICYPLILFLFSEAFSSPFQLLFTFLLLFVTLLFFSLLDLAVSFFFPYLLLLLIGLLQVSGFLFDLCLVRLKLFFSFNYLFSSYIVKSKTLFECSIIETQSLPSRIVLSSILFFPFG